MTTEETPQQTGRTPAGEQLRRAREDAGLTVSEIAERQHLRPSVIQAIESGDYQQIDSELFLKGYVRAYASQVGLAPDMVIAQLDQELEPLRREREMAEEQNPLQDIERRKQRKKRAARLVAWLVVLGLLAYVGLRVLTPISPTGDAPPEVTSAQDPQIAGQEQEQESLSPVEAPVEVEPVQPELQPEPAPAPVEAPGTAPGGVSESGQRIEGTGAEITAEPLAPQTDVAPLQEPATASEPATEFRPAEPGVDAPPVPLPPASEPEVVAEPATPAEAVDAGPDVALAASFIDPCWVEVTDANGRKLVAALFNSGDELLVEGEPPMRVVLGAADAVTELRFRGEIIDLSTYRIVNNRVEFTLDI